MDRETTKLLEELKCYEHSFDKWRKDVERDEHDKVTESRVCVECGQVQQRPARKQ
jgi:hypothetical protein